MPVVQEGMRRRAGRRRGQAVALCLPVGISDAHDAIPAGGPAEPQTAAAAAISHERNSHDPPPETNYPVSDWLGYGTSARICAFLAPATTTPEPDKQGDDFPR